MSDLALGQEFAGYLIEEQIGRGGMGVVYRAHDPSLDRTVAIKLIAGDRADREQSRARFEREARLMAAIDHPNVIPVYGAGEQDGHLYLVMRCVEGTDLQQLLRKQRRLSPTYTARIFSQITDAVGAAHARGLVHRDIKPGNVLLSGDHAYLADFGITRLVDQRTRSTDSGQWIGTVDFMSPEHLRGEPIDHLSDIYSLGALLYCCLVGSAPFHRDSAAATITAQLHDRPPRPSQVPGVPRKLDKVVARALAKRPADRYQSARALGEAVVAAVGPRRRQPVAPAAHVQPPVLALDRDAAGETAASDTVATHAAPGQTAATHVDAGHGAPDQTAAKRAAVVPQTDATAVQQPASEATRFQGAGGTATRVAIRPERSVSSPAKRPSVRRRRVLLVALAAVIALAMVASVLALTSSGSSKPAGPLTRSEIATTINGFAAAYSARDSQTLSALLAANVTRADPTSTQYGKVAVLADYRSQFSSKPTPERYTLRSVQIEPGWAGRASANYTLTLSDGSTVAGHVVFGLERVAGKVVIGLIATS